MRPCLGFQVSKEVDEPTTNRNVAVSQIHNLSLESPHLLLPANTQFSHSIPRPEQRRLDGRSAANPYIHVWSIGFLDSPSVGQDGIFYPKYADEGMGANSIWQMLLVAFLTNIPV